jgi:hypothetical protein
LAVPNLLDNSRNLMAKDRRRDKRASPLDYLEIRVADAASRHSDQHIVIANFGHFEFLGY